MCSVLTWSAAASIWMSRPGARRSVRRFSSGGVEAVFAGGTTRSATILSSGNLYVSSGGVASGTTISSGGVQHVYGSAIGTVLFNSGYQGVASGGTAGGPRVHRRGAADEVLA